MSAETDLLPLPEATMKSYQTDSTMRTMTLHSYSESAMRDYARANLAKLQREVATWKGLRESEASVRKRWQARAERLAEALRERRDWFEAQAKSISKGNGSSWDLMQVREQRDLCDAALEQETTNG